MAHEFENFLHMYLKDGKPIFVPNNFGRSLGRKLKQKVKKAYDFGDYVYHFQNGSHVVALHAHRKNQYFCRLDIHRFFYSIKRNRLKRVLKSIGIERPEYYAKWSTVKNPFAGGGYVVPYGFVQSPILATLVLAESPVGVFIRGLDPSVTASVYMDDICLSSADEGALWTAFEGLKEAVAASNFTLNDDKTREPCPQIDIFNISLENGNTQVLPERIDEFFEIDRTPAGEEAFKAYCEIVTSHTWRTGDGKRRRRRLYWRRKKARGVAEPLSKLAQIADAAMDALVAKIVQ